MGLGRKKGIKHFKLLPNYIKNGVPLEDYDNLETYDHKETSSRAMGQATR